MFTFHTHKKQFYGKQHNSPNPNDDYIKNYKHDIIKPFLNASLVKVALISFK